MTDRTPLLVQLETIERLLARAKTEEDWAAIPSLKSTADLIRWTMANADAVKTAAAVVRHPVVRRCMRHSRARRSQLFANQCPDLENGEEGNRR
jgi:hypothetical protein